jgi:dCMP deaminase
MAEVSMTNLIAYIPVLNQRHLDWFKKHRGSDLFLIPQSLAEELIPRLARNIVGVPTDLMAEMLCSAGIIKASVPEYHHDWACLQYSLDIPRDRWVLPDEDISHAFSEIYLEPYLDMLGIDGLAFERIWARYDMQAVHAMQPVMEDFPLSAEVFDHQIMRRLKKETEKSPDWWRQIAAMAMTLDGQTVVACNTHLPTEYETYIFGDPRLNVDAGQKGKYCSIHAEELVTTLCARHGYKLEGGTFYVTTFPCEGCARVIKESGAQHLYFLDGYSSLNAQDILRGHVKIIRVI